jgi:ATP-binding cassette subfamily B protein
MTPRPRRRLVPFPDAARSIAMLWRANPSWMAAVTALFCLQSIFPPLLLMALKRVIDALGHVESSGMAAALPPIIAALGLTIGETIVRAFAGLASEGHGMALTDTLRQRIAERSAALPLATIEDPAIQDLRHGAIEDGPVRAMMLAGSINIVIRAGLTLTGLALVVLTLRPLAVLLLFAGMAPLVAVRAWRTRRLHDRHLKTAALDRRAGYLWTLLTGSDGAKEVRVFGTGMHLVGRLQRLLDELRRERFAISRGRVLAETTSQVVADLALFAGLAMLAAAVAAGRITLGSMVIAFWALQYGRSLFSELLGALSGLHETLLRLTSLHAFLDLPIEPGSATSTPAQRVPRIQLRGVDLVYPGSDAPSLHAIDLTIPPGSRIALVGENGSGKTSLVKLLCGLYRPTSGEILLDDRPLDALESLSTDRLFSVLFQDFGRYELTAADNVRLGDVGLAEESDAIAAAVARAGAGAIVDRLPNGLSSQLGPRFGGADLSLGQWQKLALARALVRNAPILILDEPTSALDARAEQEIFDALWRETEGRTVIVVSHRLSTVRRADMIVVFEAGRIVEQGSHDALLAKGAIYANLFNLQAKPYR